MSRNKKSVILFLVEGSTDKEALELVLENVFDTTIVYPYVVSTDITSMYSNEDIITLVSRTVTKAISNQDDPKLFKLSDIVSVCMLTDLDGCFIPDEAVRQDDRADKTIYQSTYILSKNKEEQLETKVRKSSRIQKLYNRKSVKARGKVIPFHLYYMSCNLEDALFGRKNNSTAQKLDMAAAFADQNDGHPELFLNLMKENLERVVGASVFPFTGSPDDLYLQSWKRIQSGTASLNRGSNLICMLLSRQNLLTSEVRQFIADNHVFR